MGSFFGSEISSKFSRFSSILAILYEKLSLNDNSVRFSILLNIDMRYSKSLSFIPLQLNDNDFHIGKLYRKFFLLFIDLLNWLLLRSSSLSLEVYFGFVRKDLKRYKIFSLFKLRPSRHNLKSFKLTLQAISFIILERLSYKTESSFFLFDPSLGLLI